MKCYICSSITEASIQCVFQYDNGEKFVAKVCRKCEIALRPTIKKGA